MFKVSSVFSDNMVLQRDKNVKVFGTGDKGWVTVSLMGNTAKSQISYGKWCVTLPAMKACDNIEMIVTDGNETVIFRNVCVGEVWLAGGQSNMELELVNSLDGKKYLSELSEDMPVRYYYTSKAKTLSQAEEMEKNSGWSLCDKEGSKAWSAVGYHFAVRLAKELGVTVGIIGCNWGGSSASAWVSKETLEKDRELNSYLAEYEEKTSCKTDDELIAEYREYEKWEADYWNRINEFYKVKPDATWEEVEKNCGVNKWPGPMGPLNPMRPSGIYETMLKRVCPYTLRGFIYYQGESDDYKPQMYNKLLTALIDNWRKDWNDDELFFDIAQLPMYRNKNEADHKRWCKIREAQMRTFKTVKNTGIAVISDCGEFDNIHPVDKKPVGERLALQALYGAYGMDLEAFGPIYKNVYFKDEKAFITFDHAEQGFEVKGELSGFEMAGEDKIFKPARAEISGDKIIVSSEMKNPLFVRYDWYNWIIPSVFGKKTGIPLATFRTSADDEPSEE